MKRKLSILLAAIMVMSAISACSPTDSGDDAQTSGANDNGGTADNSGGAVEPDPFLKYDETLTIKISKAVDPNLTYPDGQSSTDNLYTRLIKDELNIEFEYMWEAATGADTNQKINLAIATNDIPDMMVVNETQFRALVNTGQLEDIKTYVDEYKSDAMATMFDSSDGKGEENVTVNGEMLALPALNVPDDGYGIVWIRKDWLDTLGLDAPQNLDDIKMIAQEFIDKDPGGNGEGNTIGIGGPANGDKLYGDFSSPSPATGSFDVFFSAMNSYPGFWIEGEDQSAMYGSIAPETRDALEELAQMYADGLIDKQMAVIKDAGEAAIAGTCGILPSPWWSGYSFVPKALDNNPEANWQAYMIANEDGVVNSKMTSISNAYCVVKKGFSNPEAAVTVNNLLIREEANFDVDTLGMGEYPLRVPMACYDEGEFTVEALKGVLAGEQTADYYSAEEFAPYKLLAGDAAAIVETKLEPYDNFDIEYWDREGNPGTFPRLWSLMVGSNSIYSQDSINEVPSLTYAQSETMETKWVTLKKMEDETFLKIIMGNEPIETFDQFVIDWKEQGGDEITEEINALIGN